MSERFTALDSLGLAGLPAVLGQRLRGGAIGRTVVRIGAS